MQVITIQNKNIINQLLKDGEFHYSKLDTVPNILTAPYKIMMKQYNYKYRPIFTCPVGYYVNFGGAHIDNALLLQLNIPDKFCKIQDYYQWSDLVYFGQDLKSFEIEIKGNPIGIKTYKEYCKYILNIYNNRYTSKEAVYQVTTQFLRKNWIEHIANINNNFLDLYYDTGGRNILHSIK